MATNQPFICAIRVSYYNSMMIERELRWLAIKRIRNKHQGNQATVWILLRYVYNFNQENFTTKCWSTQDPYPI